MAGKPLQERIAEAEKRIKQLQMQKQAMVQAAQQRERKERTRRLIQIGATLARLGMDTLEKAQAFQREVEGRPEVRQWLDEVLRLPQSGEETSTEGMEG
jgi:predicted Zn-dependent protease